MRCTSLLFTTYSCTTSLVQSPGASDRLYKFCKAWLMCAMPVFLSAQGSKPMLCLYRRGSYCCCKSRACFSPQLGTMLGSWVHQSTTLQQIERVQFTALKAFSFCPYFYLDNFSCAALQASQPLSRYNTVQYAFTSLLILPWAFLRCWRVPRAVCCCPCRGPPK